MSNEKIIENIRLALRLTNTVFDREIIALVEACKKDLEVAGVASVDTSNPLILQAITLYCKGHFGFADMGEKYISAYDGIKVSLALAYSKESNGEKYAK